VVVAVTAVLVVIGAVTWVVFRHVQPLLAGSGCEVRTHGQVYKLNASQAGIAATIAGVASHQALPNRAVTIAYAAALQESKLQDLRYGDRDSVGVFQQRPSEGWGTARALMDPVYASTKFFDALTGVHGYLKLPVYKAAQAVQRSADGTAYVQYTPTAAGLSRGFSGNVPRSVWCWYAEKPPPGPARLAAAGRQLTHAFGPMTMRTLGDPVLRVTADRPGQSWAVASWAVSHAIRYGFTEIRIGRYRWLLAKGESGWTRGPATVPPDTVEVG
jgi:hypothetical protein